MTVVPLVSIFENSYLKNQKSPMKPLVIRAKLMKFKYINYLYTMTWLTFSFEPSCQFPWSKS